MLKLIYTHVWSTAFNAWIFFMKFTLVDTFLWESCAESYQNLMKNVENMSKISLLFKSNMSFNALSQN
jgi:hypothetical protein